MWFYSVLSTFFLIMIEARKSKWFERVFALYNRHLIGRRFAGLRVAGWESLRPRDAPLLLYANHCSWWDALVIIHLNHLRGLDGYAMMEERQLQQYKFFRRLGAFGVRRDSPRNARESLDYITDILRDTPRALWIFPQGVTLPTDTRPLKLYSGAARVMRNLGKVYAAPVALRYEFLNEAKPHAFARVGPLQLFTAHDTPPKLLTQHFTACLTATLDQVRQDVLDNKLDEYQEIVTPQRERVPSALQLVH